jgi:hypothetical protein
VTGSDPRDVRQRKALERELQDKSLLLANLEVMIEDYRRERSKLIEEVMSLRESLWDLTGQQENPDEGSEMSGD